MESLTIFSAVGPMKITGNHMIFAVVTSLVIGAVTLYAIQRKYGILLPSA